MDELSKRSRRAEKHVRGSDHGPCGRGAYRGGCGRGGVHAGAFGHPAFAGVAAATLNHNTLH